MGVPPRDAIVSDIPEAAGRPELALSIVVPCYNEEESLAELHRRASAAACEVFGASWELLLVDDGSRDRSWAIIEELARSDPRIVAVRLARNHGHQLALTAGLSLVRGALVLVLDADLQDPPELLAAMHQRLREEKADVVYGVRRHRAGEDAFKRGSAAMFYRMMAALTRVDIPLDTGDFRLMTRRIADHLARMPEHDRFVRGLVAWLGHRQVGLVYDRDQRFAGITKYPLRRMLALAADAIFSFSIVPLRLATYFGLLLCVALVGIGIYAFIGWLLSGTTPGWTSLTLLIVAIAAIQGILLGIMGEYVGRIYLQTKQRPLFIIADLVRREA